MRRSTATIAAFALMAAGASCGSASTSATTTPARPPASSSVPAPAGSTTTTALPSSLDQLQPFIRAAAEVDARLAKAAAEVNRGITATTVAVGQAARDAIVAADPAPARDAIPAGLPPDLERAVLVVYSDLVSRRSAFNGVLRDDTTIAIDCLRNGARAAARFPADLAAARVKAAGLAPVGPVAPDSRAAEVLAVRFAWISGANNGCASCGGMVITELPAVTVYPGPVTPPGWDRSFDGEVARVYFTAGFVPGSGWSVQINAC